MAEDNNNRKELYGILSDNGYNVGSFEDFTAGLDDEDSRKWMYEQGAKLGYDFGTYEQFTDAMRLPTKKARDIYNRMMDVNPGQESEEYLGPQMPSAKGEEVAPMAQQTPNAEPPAQEPIRMPVMGDEALNPAQKFLYGKMAGNISGGARSAMDAVDNSASIAIEGIAGKNTPVNKRKTAQDYLAPRRENVDAFDDGYSLFREGEDSDTEAMRRDLGILTGEDEMKRGFNDLRHEARGAEKRELKGKQKFISEQMKVAAERLDKNPEWRRHIDEEDRDLRDMKQEIMSLKPESADFFANGSVPYRKSDAETSMFGTAERMMDSAISANGAPYLDSKWSAFAQGGMDALKDPKFWTMGLSNAQDQMNVHEVFQKLDKAGENADPSKVLTDGEQAVLTAYLASGAAMARRQYDTSAWYEAGKSAGENTTFVLEMMATGGLGRAAGGAVIKGIEKFAAKKGIKFLEKGAEKLAEEGLAHSYKALRAAGKSSGEALRMTGRSLASRYVKSIPHDLAASVASFAQPAFIENYAEAMNETENGGQRLAKAAFNTWKEYFTELRGEQFEPIFGLGPEALAVKLYKEGATPLLNSMLTKMMGRNFERLTFFNGFGEMFEELEGAFFDRIAGDKDAVNNFFDSRQLGVMAGSFAPMFGVQMALKMMNAGVRTPIRYGAMARKGLLNMKGEFDRQGIRIPESEWNKFIERRLNDDGSISGTMRDAVEDVQNLKNTFLAEYERQNGRKLTPEAKKRVEMAVVDYIKSTGEEMGVDAYSDILSDNLRKGAYATISAAYGGKDFVSKNDDGVESVIQYTMPDGQMAMVSGQNDYGELVCILPGGKLSFVPEDEFNPENLYSQTLDNFLDGIVGQNIQQEDAAAVEEQKTANAQPLIEQYMGQLGNPVNVSLADGTVASGTVMDVNTDGIVLETENGTIDVRWEEIDPSVVPASPTQLQMEAAGKIMDESGRPMEEAQTAEARPEVAETAPVAEAPAEETAPKYVIPMTAEGDVDYEKMLDENPREFYINYANEFGRDDAKSWLKKCLADLEKELKKARLNDTTKIKRKIAEVKAVLDSADKAKEAEVASTKPKAEDTGDIFKPETEVVEETGTATAPEVEVEAPVVETPTTEKPSAPRRIPGVNVSDDEIAFGDTDEYVAVIIKKKLDEETGQNVSYQDFKKHVGKTINEIANAEESLKDNPDKEFASKLEAQKDVYTRIRDRINVIDSVIPNYVPGRAFVQEKDRNNPLTPTELVANVMMTGEKGNPVKLDKADFMRETGYGEGEARKFVGMFKNGGRTIAALAEMLISARDSGAYEGGKFNDEDARDIVIDFFSQVRSNNDVRWFIQRNRKSELEESAKNVESEVAAAIEDEFGMSLDEYNEMCNDLKKEVLLVLAEENPYADDDKLAKLAEQGINQKKIKDEGVSTEETDVVPVSEPGAEEGGDTESGSVPEQETGAAGTTEEPVGTGSGDNAPDVVLGGAEEGGSKYAKPIRDIITGVDRNTKRYNDTFLNVEHDYIPDELLSEFNKQWTIFEEEVNAKVAPIRKEIQDINETARKFGEEKAAQYKGHPQYEDYVDAYAAQYMKSHPELKSRLDSLKKQYDEIYGTISMKNRADKRQAAMGWYIENNKEEEKPEAEKPAEGTVEEKPIEEPAVEKPEEKPENKPEKPSVSEGKSVPSQPKASAPTTHEEAKKFYESLFGENSDKAKKALRVWDLTHKAKPSVKPTKSALEPSKSDFGDLFDQTEEAQNEGLSGDEEREIQILGIELGADFVVDGARKFKDFFAKMVNTFGDGIRPFTKRIYLGIKADIDDEILDEMDDTKTVRAFDENSDINEIEDTENGNESDTDVQRPELGEEVNGLPEPEAGDTEGGIREGADAVPGTDAGDTGEAGEAGGSGTDVSGGNSEDEGQTVTGKPGKTGGKDNGGRSNTDGSRGGRRRNGSGGTRTGDNADTESGGKGKPGVKEYTEEELAAEEQKTYDATKDEIKDVTDADILKKRNESLKKELESGALSKIDAARKSGERRAVLDKLRAINAEKAKQPINLSQEKIAYVPASDPEGKYAIGSVVPSGSAEDMKAAIKRLEKDEGKSIADFVKGELGYKSVEEMFTNFPEDKYNGLSSEQVDSVGMAIHKMKNNGMFIVGDMTGVGKGRQGAAIIRWGVKNKKKVIFVTESSDLFSPMYRDLTDIGSSGLVPFIVNSDPNATITIDDNVAIEKPSNPIKDALWNTDDDKLPYCKKHKKNYDFLMMTYSQASSDAKEKTRKKLEWIKNYAKDAIVVMDEAHNASGESNQGQYFKQIVEAAGGVTFMSATWAKRPDNMMLYAIRSSMNEINMTRSDMLEAISQYGIPMQETLAKNLFKTGEMVRRERDFTDVKTHWLEPKDVYSQEEIDLCRKTADKTTELLNDIIKFQQKNVAAIIKELNKDFEEHNKTVNIARNGWIKEYTYTSTSSQVSNVVGLMLYSMKAKKAAEMAIEQIKRGEKPIIAVDNTCGSYIDEIEGIVDTANFANVLMRQLKNSMKYKFVEKQMKDGKFVAQKDGGVKITPFDSIIEKMDSTQSAAYDAMLKSIKEYANDKDKLDLVLSPIDYIEQLISDAGYKCGEITKRSKKLVKTEDGRWTTTSLNINKKKEVFKFNGGSLLRPLKKEEISDAIILNVAGATGIDLHSGRKFGDRRPRKMIILQVAKNVSTEVQMRGRGDRTGQVHRCEYFYLTSPIPCEMKLTMTQKKKIASLDANSVGTENVSSNKVDAEDMNNEYGNRIAREFLLDHIFDINSQMDQKGLVKKKNGEWESASEDLLYTLLLMSQRFSCADQEMIIEELQARYSSLIDYLDQNGINTLKSSTLNLDATTIDKAVFVKGKNNDSPSEFAHDTNIERVEVNVLKKMMKSEDINKKMKSLGGILEDGSINTNYGSVITSIVRKSIEEMIAKKKAKFNDEVAKLDESLRNRILKPEPMSEEDYELMIARHPEMAEMINDHNHEIARYTAELNAQKDDISFAATYLNLGSPCKVPITDDISPDAAMSYGRFLGFSHKDDKPRSFRAVFAVKDSRSMVEIPIVGQKDTIKKIVNETNSDIFLNNIGGENYYIAPRNTRRKAYDEWWDKMIPKNTSRQIRYLITGNILQACGSIGKYKGNITTFTRKDKETGEITVERGMLLADDFDPENFKIKTRVTKADVWDTGKIVNDKEHNISVWRSDNLLCVKFEKRGKENLKNHPAMKDETLKSLAQNNVVSGWSKSEIGAYFEGNNVEKVLDHLYQEYGFTRESLFVMPDSTEKVDAIVPTNKDYQSVIDDLGKKYKLSGGWWVENELKRCLKTYKMDVNNEDLKYKIRELVQLRQAYYRKEFSREESSRLAWSVLILEQQIDRAGDDKDRREMAYNKMLAGIEELNYRGVKGNVYHFKEGETTLEETWEKFYKFNSDEFNDEISKRVFAQMKKVNLKPFYGQKIDTKIGGQTVGNMLEYNWKYMSADWITDQMKADTILHEQIHTLTVYAKRCIDNGYDHLLTDEHIDACNELSNIYDCIKRDSNFVHETYTDYGVYDWYEMLAEAGSNPTFREDLKKTTLIAKNKSGFITFYNAKDNKEINGKVMTAYDAVIERLNFLIDNFLIKGYTEFFRGTGVGEIEHCRPTYRSFEENTEQTNALHASAILSGTIGVSPAGSESMLNNHDWAMVRTKAFKKEFGDWEKGPEATIAQLDKRGEPVIEEGMVAVKNTNKSIIDEKETDSRLIGKSIEAECARLGVTPNIHKAQDLPRDRRNKYGWYDPNDNSVHFVANNIKNVGMARATVMHEVIGHKGLADLVGGGEQLGMFLDSVYNNASTNIQKNINKILNEEDNGVKRYANLRQATEEYLARLAERGPMDNQERSFWDKVVALVRDLMRRAGFTLRLTEADVAGIIHSSYLNLTRSNPKMVNFMQMAENRVMNELLKDAGIASHDTVTKKNGGNGSNDGGNRYSSSNANQAIFVSNAAKAVEALNITKASGENWIKAIQGKGGLKAGEDKWIGLSDWLSEQKGQVTKAQVQDFINQNRIRIEEQGYVKDLNYKFDYSDMMAEAYGEDFRDKFYDSFILLQDDEDGGKYSMPVMGDYKTAKKFYNENNPNSKLQDNLDHWASDLSKMEKWALKVKRDLEEYANNGQREIEKARLSYTNDALTNKREIALTIPSINPYHLEGKNNDLIHFGDADDGRAIAWARFGDSIGYELVKTDDNYKEIKRYETLLKERMDAYERSLRYKGKALEEVNKKLSDTEDEFNKLASRYGHKKMAKTKVLFIDEIQSKRHQDAREKGYRDDSIRNTYESKKIEYLIALKKRERFEILMSDKYGALWFNKTTDEENEEIRKLRKIADDAQQDMLAYGSVNQRDILGIPPAPFEKNWHELTFKRMMRLAAEEGYGRIAWTTGEMQADRYDLRKRASKLAICRMKRDKNKFNIIAYDRYGFELTNIVSSSEKLQDTIGKELAQKALEPNTKYEDRNVDWDVLDIEGDDLRIGGEGMSGFYDKILPDFVNKYCKRWGVKVEDVLIGGDRAHSIEVTPEMRASVMEGQPMFKSKNRNSAITPEMDAEYLQAVENGDYVTMIRLLNQAARAALAKTKVADEKGNPLVVYHGSPSTFTVFRKDLLGLSTEADSARQGFFFTPKKYIADWFKDIAEVHGDGYDAFKDGVLDYVSKNATQDGILEFLSEYYYDEYDEDTEWNEGLRDVALEALADRMEGWYDSMDDLRRDLNMLGANPEKTYEVFLNMENPEIDTEFRDYASGQVETRMTDIIAKAKKEGKDGVIFTNIKEVVGGSAPQYVVFEPNQIKSAELVTYDNFGNVIPLSERFNPDIDDIRFRNMERRGIVTPEQDAAFQKAYESNDEETARRMVREAAEAAMPNSKVRGKDGNLVVVYHGTEWNPYEEPDGKAVFNGGWFTGLKRRAEGFGEPVAVYLDITDPIFSYDGKDSEKNNIPEGMDLYRPETWAGHDGYISFSTYPDKPEISEFARRRIKMRNPNNYEEVIKEHLANQPAGRQLFTVIPATPVQIKSADPFTFDAEGKLIPLSERFNEYIEDIRFKNSEESTNVTPEQDMEYLDAVRSGDMAKAKKMVRDAANRSLGAFNQLQSDENITGFKYHRGKAPKKTRTMYAVFNVSDDGFRAAYAGNNVATPVGVWLDAQNLKSYESSTVFFDDGTPATYIPGDTGKSTKVAGIDPASRGKEAIGKSWLLERGGKHGSDLPNFSQMNLGVDEDGNKVKSNVINGALPHNKLVFEIECGMDENGDLTEYVKKNGRMMKGKNQGLKNIKPNQFYFFKTNSNAVGNWGIAGTFRIKRLVPYDEIVRKSKEAGIPVQKWVGGYHPEDFGLSVESVDAMYQEGLNSKLMDAVTYDNYGDVIPLSERFNGRRQDLRFSEPAPDYSDPKAFIEVDQYSDKVNGFFNRLKEVLFDETIPVLSLLKVIVNKTGKPIGRGENVADIMKATPSKGQHEREEFRRTLLDPLLKCKDDILDKLKDLHLKEEMLAKYMALKHGMERQIVFAKRDATQAVNNKLKKALEREQERYKSEVANVVAASAEELKGKLSHLQGKHNEKVEKITDYYKNELERIAAGDETQKDYAKYRQKEYGAIRVWFGEYIDDNGEKMEYLPPKEDGESYAHYNNKIRKYLKLPEGFEDIKVAEEAANKEIALIEKIINRGGNLTDELWDKVRKATDRGVELQYQHHVITKEMRDKLLGNGTTPRMFSYYIPMRGFALDTAEDIFSYSANGGSDNNFVRPFINAKGRVTKPDSPFAYIGAMHDSSTAQAFKNDVAEALYKFAINHKDNGLITVSRSWFKAVLDDDGEITGWEPAYPKFEDWMTTEDLLKEKKRFDKEMEALRDEGHAFNTKRGLNLHNAVINIDKANKPKHIVRVKHLGEDYDIIINGDPRAAEMINGNLRADYLAGNWGAIMRWFSASNTSWRPAFYVTNLQRDLIFGASNIAINHDGKYTRKYLRNLTHALRVIPMYMQHGEQKGKQSGKDDYYYSQFADYMKFGAPTGQAIVNGHAQWEEICKRQEKIDRLPSAKATNGLVEAGKFIMEFGESVEQISRFAAFLTAREMGMPIEKAVMEAKNVTLNFNQKGSNRAVTKDDALKMFPKKDGWAGVLNWGRRTLLIGASQIPKLRYGVIFYNAIMQGIYTMLRNIGNHPVKGAAFGFLPFVALGAVSAIVRGGGGDDDDPWTKISDYQRHNRIMMKPYKTCPVYLIWGIPQEYAPFMGLGDNIVRLAQHKQSWDETWKDTIREMCEQLPVNPFNMDAPAPIQAFWENYNNRNYLGQPISKRNQYNQDQPGFLMSTSKTWRLLTDLSYDLNRATGGSTYKKGAIDIDPAKLQNIIEGIGGGALQDVLALMDDCVKGMAILGGDDTIESAVRDWPVLHRLIFNPSDSWSEATTREHFDMLKDEIDDIQRRINRAKKDAQPDEVEKMKGELEYRFLVMYNADYKKALDNIDDELHEAVSESGKKMLMAKRDEIRREWIERCFEMKFEKD